MLAILAGGCQSGAQPKGDDLQGVVKRFHHNLRWKYNEDVAARVAPKYSSDFRDRLEDLSKDWNVTAWDVRKVEVEPEGKRAKIRVHLNYYYMNSPVVKEEKIQEVWELVDDQWILTSWQGGPLQVPPDDDEATDDREPGEKEAGDKGDVEATQPDPREGADRVPPPKDTVRDLPDDPEGE